MSLFERARTFAVWNGEAALQMGWDESLFEAAERADLPATLRFSTWSPAAVSIGRFQDAARAVDSERARALGFDVVRRPTGGRAVLHEGDLVYTLVARRDDPVFGGPRPESLRAVGEALAAGLAALGVACVLADGRAEPASGSGVAPCFASASREEVRSAGRKLVGSARVEGRRAFLQHGSIALAGSPSALADLLPIPDRARAAFAERLSAASISLEEIVGRRVAPASVARALADGFERRSGRPFEKRGPTSVEATRARRLASDFVVSHAATPAAAIP